MSPFRSPGAKTYKARVYDRAGRRYIRSLGTRLIEEARTIEAFLLACRRQRRWDVCEAVIAGPNNGGLDAFDAWQASVDGTLAEQLADRRRRQQRATEPDCDQLVAEWALTARSPKYVTQVRTLIGAGTPFPLSQFTRATIARHLRALPASNPTRNRYRVAFSQFARWLVEHEYLERNMVREIAGFGEHDPRMVHYSPEETQAVMRRLTAPADAAIALMAGAGLEVGAVLALHRRDLDLETGTITVHGTKTRFRRRLVRVTEPWAWAIIERHVRPMLPDARLFELTHRQLRQAHDAACVAAEVAPSRLHDWRHTYAIKALRDGLPPQTVKRQLGHSPHSTMLERVYAAWVPARDADYLATNLATSRRTSMRKQRGAR